MFGHKNIYFSFTSYLHVIDSVRRTKILAKRIKETKESILKEQEAYNKELDIFSTLVFVSRWHTFNSRSAFIFGATVLLYIREALTPSKALCFSSCMSCVCIHALAEVKRAAISFHVTLNMDNRVLVGIHYAKEHCRITVDLTGLTGMTTRGSQVVTIHVTAMEG